jgi:hypothetical protein
VARRKDWLEEMLTGTAAPANDTASNPANVSMPSSVSANNFRT